MFRSRFSEAFQKSVPHFGPQDIESGVVDSTPSEQVEKLLCALIGLVLNRKKDPEYVHCGQHSSLGHYLATRGLRRVKGFQNGSC